MSNPVVQKKKKKNTEMSLTWFVPMPTGPFGCILEKGLAKDDGRQGRVVSGYQERETSAFITWNCRVHFGVDQWFSNLAAH